LVEREREIRAFIPDESWKIDAHLSAGGIDFSLELQKISGKIQKPKNETETADILKQHGIVLSTLTPKKDKKNHLSYDIPHKE
jgi:DNA topoisomerase-1